MGPQPGPAGRHVLTVDSEFFPVLEGGPSPDVYLHAVGLLVLLGDVAQSHRGPGREVPSPCGPPLVVGPDVNIFRLHLNKNLYHARSAPGPERYFRHQVPWPQFVVPAEFHAVAWFAERWVFWCFHQSVVISALNEEWYARC